MQTIQKVWKFYIGSYLIMVTFAIIGLIYNIKTISINDKIQKITQETNRLSEENWKLELEALQKATMPKLEQMAEKLNLQKPEHVKYLFMDNDE